MAFEAEFVHGEPTFADYTAGADILAGQVVPLGGATAGTIACGVAHHLIANGTLGALAIGGGVYKLTIATATVAWAKVYWDDTANKLTTTSTSNSFFGYTLAATTGANGTAEVLHSPYG